ncbi:MAG TPA: hypothetical protein DIU48_11185 [Acidobacteria bacterium]|nr:hypothetical protein [Acidobacteriota bacterium]
MLAETHTGYSFRRRLIAPAHLNRMTDPPADRHPQPEDESTRWLGKTDQWRSDMLTDQDKDFAE